MAVAVLTDLAIRRTRDRAARRCRRAHALADSLEQGFRFDKSGVVSTSNGEVFIHVHNPALRLVIIGAVHIAQAVVPMAQALGYDITVIDPRGAFATPERFSGVTLHADWPDDVLPEHEAGCPHRLHRAYP
jgi:xanthine dehydrogenase accessory factor